MAAQPRGVIGWEFARWTRARKRGLRRAMLPTTPRGCLLSRQAARQGGTCLNKISLAPWFTLIPQGFWLKFTLLLRVL